MGFLRELGKKGGEFIVPSIMLAYATYYYLEVSALPRREVNLLLIQPVYFVILAAFLVLVAAYVCRSLAGKNSQASNGEASERKITNKAATLSFAVLTVAYVYGIEWLGFVASSWLYMTLLLMVFSVKSWLIVAVFPAGTALFIYLTFDMWLSIPLPKGILS
ncbi:tripartite tricarboxylate transporter TctB family protein [Halomonas chromatireducens]|uniref:Tripartite tricarboxylate transporter TctB family protein n=1 Tax=Halomonas chromatireducens TaxID=507626 RepID=A0A0X8HFE0_9GAMM|nr:tripartite tricarboxylate transporter TctB family protein [Halomonas chromatireducens]AMD01570.1 Tripartite tricarboxylate transporter TctB family protein [Halomonas chromatireducens]